MGGVGSGSATVRRDVRPHGKIIKVEDWAESELAWELTELAADRISDHDRRGLYTTIGAGDSYAAVCMLLETLVYTRVQMSRGLVARIGAWLEAYQHHDDAARLHELLSAIRAFGSPNCP
jgi:hypothetical protein